MAAQVDTTTTTVDQTAVTEFLGRFVADLGATISAPPVVIGDRLGLYKGLAAGGPQTSAELAHRTGCAKRYVREWLCNPGRRRLRGQTANRREHGGSASICTPAGLLDDGAALGNQVSDEQWEGLLRSPGFTRFRRAAETPFNRVFEVRP